MMTTRDKTLAEAGAMTIPEVINIRKQLSATRARAEAAEAERNTAARRAFNAEADNQRLTAENRRLAARVAELEAALGFGSQDDDQDDDSRDGELGDPFYYGNSD